MSHTLSFQPRRTSAPSGFWQTAAAPFELRLLTSPPLRSAAFRLRFKAYASMGYELDAHVGEFKDVFDDQATTVHFGAYDDGRLVACMRLCFCRPGDTVATLPCGPHYPELHRVRLDHPGTLVEISRLAIDPDIANTSYRTTLYGFMVRAAFTAAQAARVSMILVATRPDWVKFYKYMLGFEQIAAPAFYPPGDFKIALMGGSLTLAKQRQAKQNRFFKTADDEVVNMREVLTDLIGLK